MIWLIDGSTVRSLVKRTSVPRMRSDGSRTDMGELGGTDMTPRAIMSPSGCSCPV
jgi:hypothetical protein